jgi:hypothetical protein
MEQLTAPAIDKSKWGPGPWQDEPDRVDFVHAGFACFAKRHPSFGSWCGYVGVPREHPLYRRDWDEVDGLDVHGGVNYSAKCDPASGICHVPEPGMPDDVWWLGFECAHGFDLVPGTQATLRVLMGEAWRENEWLRTREVYRALPYVRRQIEALADQEVYRALPYVRRQIEALADQLSSRAALSV